MMSAAAGSAHSSPPPTSAAVLEFICLFTHDLRRKQKRWQDGRLKYHSFNKRVMVYDDRGNFVGDLHWRRDYEFDEGEEIQLERGGVIVQVQELVHRTEQDLSELLEKRAKEKEQRQVQAAARPSVPSAALPRAVVRPVTAGSSQTRHRPLHQIIGTPSGHHGKAVVPRDSPYEQRHQPVESPNERAAKRRKYDEPPPSKSGYAQALFGQTLTLTATPVSSALARRLPARATGQKPEPSSSAETSACQVRGEPKTILREQSKSSHHFNQPLQRQSVVSTPAQSRPVHGVEMNNEVRVRRNQDHSLPQIPHIERQTDSAISDDDVVEIDDPRQPTLVYSNKAQKAPAKPARIREQTNGRPTVNALSTKVSGAKDTRAGEASHQTHEHQYLSKTEERLDKLNKLKITAPKAAVKKSAAQVPVPKDKLGSPFDELPKRSPGPTTEFRIKSSKKRGLLMVSEILKKPHEQRPGNSAASRATFQESQAMEVDCGNATLRSPSPPPHAGTNMSGIRHKDKSLARRKDSTELEEEDDPFRSPSSALSAEQAAIAGRSIMDQSVDFEAVGSGWQDEDVAIDLRVDPVITDIVEGKPVAEINQNTAPSSPRRKFCDPDQLPSSSTEEPSNYSTRAPPSPTKKASPSINHATGPEFTSITNNGSRVDHVKKAVKAKQVRRIPRNIVLGEEDLDGLPGFAEQASINLDETNDSDYDTNPSSPKRNSRLMRHTNAVKTSPRRQSTTGKIDSGKQRLGDGRNEAEPRKASIMTKRKAQAYEKSPSPEAEEQPHKRRRSTRKKVSRTAELEEMPLLSEQEEFEDESTSRNLRKNKTHNVTEDRPRLATIKKSVKSRELIGFDLTSLNTPLGLRGIGVPFSILPSLADKSAIRVDDQPVMDKRSDSIFKNSDEQLPFDTLDAHEAIVDADGMARGMSAATASNDKNWIAQPSLDKQLDSYEITGEPPGPVQLVPPTSTKELARQSSVSSQKCGTKSSEKGDTCLEASASPTPLEKRPSEESQNGNTNTAEIVKATVEVALANKGKSSLLSAVPSDKPRTENPVATIPSELSAETVLIDSEPVPALASSKTAVGLGSTLTSSIFRPTAALLEVPQDLGLQSSRMANNNTDDRVPDLAESSDKPHGATTTVMASMQKQTPPLSRQSSRMSASITNDEAPQDTEATEHVREGSAPAAAQPSTALVPKPSAGLQRQPSALRPVTMAKHDAGHVESETNIAEALFHVDPPQKPTPALARQSSNAASVDNIECGAVADDQDAVQNSRSARAPAPLIQRPKSHGLHRATSITRRINNITVIRPEPELVVAPAEESSTKPARLANPASRGRKAALKSDAAGSVPQRVLPLTQPSAMIPISTADLASTPLEEPPKPPERPKKKMTFPGFQSAKGEGPWSREAFDLLETRRPE